MKRCPSPSNEVERLDSLDRLHILDTESEPEFDGLVRVASLVCEVPIALISLVALDRQCFKANIGLPGVAETAERKLVRFVFIGLCLICLAAAGATAAPVEPLPVRTKQTAERTAAPAPLSSASTVSSAFLATLTEEERDWLRAHPVIRVVQDPNWPPIEFADERGNPSGMTRDYLSHIEARLGQKFEPVLNLSWQEAYARLKSAEIDMTTTVAETPERLEFWAFTKPYMNIPIVIATQQDVTYISNMHELAGKRVAVVDGYAVNDWIPRDFPEIRLVKVKTSLEGLQQVQRGEVDAFIDSLLTIGYYQARRDVLNLKIAGATPYFNAQRMAVRKDWAPFAGILQKALDSISVAQRDEIQRRWLPLRYEHGFDYTLLWQAMAIFAVVLLGLGLWNRKLVDEVRARKQAEQALLHGRVMMERTEHLAHLASFEWEVNSNIVTWSPEMFNIFGRDPALGIPNLEGQAELYTPESTRTLFDAVGRAVSDGTPYTLELTAVRPGGEQRICFVQGFPERDAGGRVIRLAGLVHDLTDRKQTEAALKDSEERWKFAVEGAGDGLWDRNVQTGKAFYSLRYKTMLGFEDDEIGDPADEWTKRIHPDDAPGVRAAMQPYMDGKPGSATVEFRMLCKDGSWRWIMGRGMVVERDAQGKPLRIIGINTDITQRKEQQHQLERIAHFDSLTNLPNRVLLADRLQQAMLQEQRRSQKLAVAYLDLDGFKAVNDRHGHNVGDQLLIGLANRMKDALREGDTLARIGGDEFVAVLVDLAEPALSEPLLERLLAAAALPVQVGDLALMVSASLGVTFYPQAQGIDAEQLLRQADQAMYQAKVAGKNRYHVFDAAQDSNLRGHHQSLERIRLALAQGEFVLHYQPKVNMRSGQVVGAEALIRWQHPEQGLLAPATFLPVIEDHPLAVSVGEWVIDTAMHQMHVWQTSGLHLPVSVNIGARQLQQINFVERLTAILAKHPQVDPANLELEILETSALADITLVSGVIEDCAKIGVKFALDDFGTGYSSLTYLKRLPVTLLKIDQSFVRHMLDDPDDLAILQGVIGLAVAFKRDVIAEGVETVAHGTALLQLGCELAQGYGIARPMAPEHMPAWVATWQPDAAGLQMENFGGTAKS